MKQEKSSNKPPNGGYQKVLVKVKDALCSPMMGAPTKEWGEPQSPGIMFFQISTQEAPHTEAINKNIKKGNTIIIHMGDNILNAAEEARINKNWCLLNNHSTCIAFINRKYLSNVRYSPDGKYPRVHCNAGVTHTNIIGDRPGYSNPVWYNPKGIANILSRGLVLKNHLVTYNSHNGNDFVIHRPQRPTFKIIKAGLFYNDIRNLLKNKDTCSNNSHYPLPQLQDKKKGCTDCDIKRADCTRQFQHS